jgi:hypothetical protein|nr:MAG: hypothetical protein [Bacteriophage sp.]UWG16247.1 MAG: hypothetical protein [Bacteriophage sp.]
MAQSVIVKKEEKVTRVFQELGVNCSFDDFFTKFKETYPGDWERVQKVYRQHVGNMKCAIKKAKDILCLNQRSICEICTRHTKRN